MNTDLETNVSIRSLVDRHAVERPSDVFAVDPHTGDHLTFAKLQVEAQKVASTIKAQGVKVGDNIGFAMTNGLDAIKVVLGIIYAGNVATAINLVSGTSTISYVLSHSQAPVVFVQQDTKGLIDEALAADFSGDAPRLFNIGSDQWSEPEQALSNATSSDDDGLLMYTSGTTGVPKGVVLTQRNLLAGGANAAIAHELGPDDRGLCVLPLYHINGLCVTVMGPLISAGSVIMPNRFSVKSFWDQLREHRGTWFSVVPTQISYLLQEAQKTGHQQTGLEQLRFGRSASAPLSPDVQTAFETQFQVPVIETMGLTETAAQILSNPMNGERKIGSPGIAFGNEVMIGNDQQVECGRGVEGEVLVRGENVMRCYRNNETATSESLMADGWLRTGDLGRMDDDGYVFITGRLKELIIKGGENIAPREIDEALYSHPDVIEAAAFARPCNDYGQRVEAGVMVKEGSVLTSEMLVDLCRKKIGAFKAPDHVHFFPELPKGPSGKIQRLKVADLAAKEV